MLPFNILPFDIEKSGLLLSSNKSTVPIFAGDKKTKNLEAIVQSNFNQNIDFRIKYFP